MDSSSSSSRCGRRRRRRRVSSKTTHIVLLMIMLLMGGCMMWWPSAAYAQGPQGCTVELCKSSGSRFNGDAEANACCHRTCDPVDPQLVCTDPITNQVITGQCRACAGCYCGQGCEQFGDCCSNYYDVCIVPNVNEIAPVTADTSGNIPLRISGLLFGTAGTVTVGGVNCPVLSYAADTIFCTLPPGTGVDHLIVVTDADTGKSSIEPVTFSYNPPVIDSLAPSPPLLPTSGARITLLGSSFGTQGDFFIPTINGGFFAATDLLHDHTNISFTVPAGEGVNNAVSFFLGTPFVSANALNFNYRRPQLDSISPSASGPTSGNNIITIIGANFGLSATVTIGGEPCVLAAAQTHFVYQCTVPPGQGVQRRVSMTVGGQVSNGIFYSYDPPLVSNVLPDHGPTAGGTLLEIVGSNFGNVDMGVLPGRVAVGDGTCDIVSWGINITCTTPAGDGGSAPVRVIVGELVSLGMPWEYDPPTLLRIHPDTGPTQGALHVTATGTNFGFAGVLTIGGQPCAPVIARNHSSITCETPAGAGTTNAAIVEVQAILSQESVNFAYGPPTIDDIAPPTADTGPPVPIVITGTNFGVSGTVTVGGQRCQPTVPFAHTRIDCLLPIGQGTNKVVEVIVSGQSVTSTDFSYNIPTIDEIDPPNGPTGGGIPITLNGASFGSGVLQDVLTDPPRIFVGTGECTVLFGQHTHSQIVCVLPPGQGSVPVTITVGGQESDAIFFSYAPPSISLVFPDLGPTLGQVPITITGESFDLDGVVTVGGRVCDILTYSHAAITCTLPEGQGNNVQVRLAPVSGATPATAVFSYAAPVLSLLSPSTGDTNGIGNILQITGSNFGVNGTVTVAGVDCPVVENTYSHSSIECLLPPGEGIGKIVLVEAGGQTSTNFRQFAYNGPTFTNVSPENGPTAGNIELVLTGTNFGLTATVTVQNSLDCPVTFRSADHTELRCTLPAGQGQSALIQVNVASQLSSPLPFDYDGPELVSVTPDVGPTAGGIPIELLGSNFGTLGIVNIGSTSCEITSHTDDRIVCVLPVGQGTNRDVQVQVSASPSNTLPFSYAGPEITDLFPATSGPTSGDILLTVVGENFGTTGFVKVSNRLCGLDAVGASRNHTHIVCELPPGEGAVNPVTVTVLSLVSVSENFAYGAPSIDSIDPPLASTEGRVPITIHGANFGVGTGGSVLVGGQPCPATGSGFTHTTIVCLLPQGQGRLVDVVVAVSQQSDTSTDFSYEAPVITSVLPAAGPTSGDISIVLEGTSFGLNGAVTVGGAPCPITSHTHRQIACDLPAGRGVNQLLELTVELQIGSSSFDYIGPSITSIEPDFGPAAGGTRVTIDGESFDTLGSVTIGGSVCSLESYDHAQIVCIVPPGQGEAVAVRVEAVTGLSDAKFLFDYDAPQIASADPDFGATAGGTVIEIRGTNFGSAGTVTLGSIPCPIFNQVYSNERVLCTAPSGDGLGKLIVLTAGDQSSNGVKFDYSPPALLAVNPQHGPTSGGALITLTGENFGLAPTVSVGGVNCPVAVGSQNHTFLVCRVQAGQGINKGVQINAASQLSNVLPFNYDAPIVDVVDPTSGPTLGEVELTITGQSLGVDGVVTVGGRSCPVTFHNHSKIVCTLPAGEDVNQVVRVTISSATNDAFVFNYDRPSILDVAPQRAAAGDLVIVTGENFGTSGFVTIDGSTCASSSGALVHSEIRCEIPAGQGENLNLVVTVGTQTSDPELFSYEAPSITGVNPPIGPTIGGITVEVTGSNFGPAGGVVTIGSRQCPVLPNSYSDVRILCQLPPGQGTSLPVIVEVGEQASASFPFSYAAPQIDSVSPNVGPTNGNIVVVLSGSDFGVTGSVTVGGEPCAIFVSRYGHGRVECLLPAGTGVNQDVIITVGQQTSAPASFSYNAPDLGVLEPSHGSTGGGFSLTIHGTSLGAELAPTTTVAVVSGGSSRACVPTDADHDFLVCTMPPGTGGAAPVQVTVDNSASGTLPFAYDAPVIDRIEGCSGQTGNETFNCRITGVDTITIIGRNFGQPATLTPSVTIASLACTNIAFRVAEAEITCLVPASPRGGFNVEVAVSLDGLTGTSSQLSYSGPIIFEDTLFDVSAPGTVGDIFFPTTDTNAIIEFRGRNFGSSIGALHVRFGLPGDSDRFNCTVVDFVVTPEADQTVRCQLDTGGVGENLVFRITVGLQVSAESVDTLSFQKPVIEPATLRLVGGEKTINLFGTNAEGEYIQFDGDFFGEDASVLGVVYGFSGLPATFTRQCTDVSLIPIAGTLSTIQCRTEPGEGGPFVFIVSALNALSDPGTDQYNYPTAPIVTQVLGCPRRIGNATADCPTVGGLALTVRGSNFAASNVSTSVRVGINNCGITRFVGSSEIQCLLPAGRGFNQTVVVTVGKRFSLGKPLVSYAQPFLYAISGCVDQANFTIGCPRLGGAELTLTGTNFGVGAPKVLIGGSPCPVVTHTDERVTCTLAPGAGVTLSVLLAQLQGEVSGNTLALSYEQCPAGTFAGETSCEPCTTGRFSAAPGEPACSPCDPGRFANVSGSTSCEACPAGRFSVLVSQDRGADNCTLCPAGEFNPAVNAFACTECELGSFSAVEGASTCERCAPGQSTTSIGVGGATSCVNCTAGTFAPGEGSVVCRECAPGTFADTGGSTICDLCAAGSYQTEQGSDHCVPCDLGTASSSQGQPLCPGCDAGSFSNDTGLIECIQCPVGTARLLTDGLECVPCEEGTFMNVEGQAVCILCERGTFSDAQGATLCEKCAPGTFSSAIGAVGCENCTLGRFASVEGNIGCRTCPPGRHANVTGLSECVPCPAGTFSDDFGAIECTPCPIGTANNALDQIECTNCLSGFSASRTGLVQCERCSPGRFASIDPQSPVGPTQCDPCEPGTFNNAESVGACLPCQPGFVMPDSGATSCVACDPGQVSEGGQVIACDDCVAGRFSSASASFACSPCDAGSYSADGATICTACAPGSSQSESGATSCDFCLPGFFQNVPGMTLCLPCTSGRFSEASNATACIDCDAGSIPSFDRTSCVPCPEGEVTFVGGESQCDVCPQGRFSNVSGSHVCYPCAPGFFSLARAAECEPCPVGRFAEAEATVVCEDCASGRFSDALGASTCSLCARGSQQGGLGEQSCVPCEAGTFANAEGSGVCSPCAVGTFAGDTNQFVCDPCPEGTIASTQGLTACVNCSAGRFASGTGNIACSFCDRGFYSPSDGSTGCQPCPVGTFASESGAFECDNCPLGRASSTVGQATCDACVDGRFANTTGATVCFQCGEGTFSTGSSAEGAESCELCPPGRFQNAEGRRSCSPCTLGTAQPASGMSFCEDCAVGTFARFLASEVCVNCTAGTFSAALGAAACTPCEIGRFSGTGGATVCEACTAGSQQDESEQSRCDGCPPGFFTDVTGAATCKVCPVGRFSNASFASACLVCAPGRFQDTAGQTSCEPCRTGTAVSDAGEAVCKPCDIGTFASIEGSTVCRNCPAGTFAQETQSATCTNCSAGEFSSSERSFSCDPCPAGSISALPGASECAKCPVGRVQPFDGQRSCEPCPEGTFNPIEGEASCLACLLGTSNNLTGQATCAPCAVGRFASSGRATACTACNVGEFASSTRSVTCDPCLIGTFSETPGSASCTPCGVGSFQASSGQDQCEDCPRGTFTDAVGQSECVGCQSGTFANRVGSSICTRCSAGRFSQRIGDVGASTCVRCSVGEFQPADGQAVCDPCPVGTFQGSRGSTACELCDPGQFAPALRSSACLDCTAGSFSSGFGNFACAPCRAGTFGDAPLASSCTQCPAGRFRSTEGATTCEDCTIGKYTATSGSVTCVDCPAGRFSNTTGLQDCLRCEPGTSQTLSGSTDCIECPAGRFNPLPDQAVCALCPSGRFNPEIAQIECAPCDIGFAQAVPGESSCEPCEPGSFIDALGEPRCKECVIGKFSNVSQSTVCDDCELGKFSFVEGSTVCGDCPAGRFGEGSGTVTCAACQPGRFSDASAQPSCTLCIEGKFQELSGGTSCEDCPFGQFSSVRGAQLCELCPQGRAVARNGSTVCDACPRGRVAGDEGLSECLECPAGETTDASGQAACDRCELGTFAATPGSSICDLCPLGQFSNVSASTQCNLCAPGSFASAPGSQFCTGCPVGRFSNESGASLCDPCPAGTFQDVVGSSACIPCLIGSFSEFNGAEVCELCSAGRFSEVEGATTCDPCEAGMSSTGVAGQGCIDCLPGRFARTAGLDACELCPPGSAINVTRATSCVECEPGYFQDNTGQLECIPCPIGSANPFSGRQSCIDCPAGSVSTIRGATVCDVCGAGRFQNQDGASACLECLAGTFNEDDRQELCNECPVGKYQPLNGTTFCHSCEPGSAQNIPGSTECVLCDAGSHAPFPSLELCLLCEPGYFSNLSGMAECTPCGVGTDQVEFGKTTCASCEPGSFAEFEGTILCADCAVGTFSNQSNSVVCELCQPGRFQDILGQTECLLCPAGSFNDAEGGSVCNLCLPGSFSNESGSIVCKQCPPGNSQVDAGQTDCALCPRGTHSGGVGQSGCVDCEVGRFSSAEGVFSCPPCPVGRFQPNFRSTTCELCPIGRATAVSGREECEMCVSGTFANETGMQVCSPCAPGQFQNEPGQAACQACDAGSIASLESTSECVLCEAGTFATETGSTLCETCVAGRFAVSDGSVECLACEPGRFMGFAGGTLCEECVAGTFAAGSGSTTCTQCASGTRQAQTGQTSCVSCEPGAFVRNPGQAQCSLCEAGKFSTVRNATVCQNCEPGKFQFEIGSTRCELCRVGEFSSFSGADMCMLCTPGRFGTTEGALSCDVCGVGEAQLQPGRSSCDICVAGRFSNVEGLSECTLCPAGTFTVDEGRTVCDECNVGEAQGVTGSTACDACVPGEFLNARRQGACNLCAPGSFSNFSRATVCQLCAAGTFQSLSGETACTLCSNGRFQVNVGQSHCDDCPAGTSNGNSSTSCVLCQPGKFQSGETPEECQPCAPGTFSDIEGRSVCSDCPFGRFAAISGHVACDPCSVGTSQVLSGQESCQPCPLGRFTDSVAQESCQDCESGRYSTGNSSTCVVCETGKAQPSAGQGACDLCSPGRAAPVPGQEECQPCRIGEFSGGSGSSECLSCPAGTFSNAPGTSECEPCGVGTAQSSPGGIQCEPCPTGRFASVNGSRVCLPCPAGSHQSRTGQSLCDICLVGEFADTSGMSQCDLCEAGRFSAVRNLTLCDLCPGGRHQPLPGQSFCSICNVSTFAGEGQSFCSDCAPGRFGNSTGASSCIACAAGFFQSATAQTSCDICAIGSANFLTGQAQCARCRVGTFSDTTGAAECTQCAPGFHSEFLGATVCSECGPGRYSAGGQELCIDCEDGSVANTSGTESCAACGQLASPNSLKTECLCNTGYWLPYFVVGSNEWNCESCPLGAVCDDVGTTFKALAAKEGWWRPTNDSSEFYRCLLREHCIGGFAQSSVFGAESGSGCAGDRVGIMCAHCREGFRPVVGSDCEACPDEDDTWVFIVVVAIVVAFFVWLQLYIILKAGAHDIASVQAYKHDPRWMDDPEAPDSDYDSEDIASSAANDSDEDVIALRQAAQHRRLVAKKLAGMTPTEKLQKEYWMAYTEPGDAHNEFRLTVHGPPQSQPNFTYKLKIFLSFLQVATMLGTGLEIQWPSRFKTFILYFDVLNLNFLLTNVSSTDCLDAVDYYFKFMIIVLAPIAVFFLIFMFYLLPKYFGICQTTNPSIRQRSKMKFWKMCLYLLFLIYPSLSSTVIRHYVCKDIGDDRGAYLLVDLREKCHTDQWVRYAWGGILLILMYPLGIPLFFFSLLYRNRKHLRDVQIRAQLGFLYAGYRGIHWWFEMTDSVHKLMMTSILALFPLDSQLPIGIVVLCLYLVVILLVNPYLRGDDDKLHLLAQTELALLLLAGWVFYNRDVQDSFDDKDDWVVSIALIFIVVVFIITFIYYALAVVRRWRRAKRREKEMEEAALAEEKAGRDAVLAEHARMRQERADEMARLREKEAEDAAQRALPSSVDLPSGGPSAAGANDLQMPNSLASDGTWHIAYT